MENENATTTPPYFYFYTKYCNYFDLLTSQEAGAVIKYICDYVRNKDSQLESDSPSVIMLCEFMKTEINNAFKKYRAQCENGKKGGAPKGNKNAAKKTKFIYDNLSSKVSYMLSDVLYFEAEKNNCNLDDYFSKSQLASIAACYCIQNVFGFEDIFEKNFKYKSLSDFVINEGAAKVCKILKEDTKEWYNSDHNQTDETFTEVFAKYKQTADKLLKMPKQELSKYSDWAYAIENDDKTEEDLKKDNFTNDEIKEILATREQLRNAQAKQTKQDLPEGQPAPRPEHYELREFFEKQFGYDDAYFCSEFTFAMEKNGNDWQNWQRKMLAYAVKTGKASY